MGRVKGTGAGSSVAARAQRGALSVQEGWLVGARRLDSPNQDERPPGETVSLIVIHAISLPPERFSGDAVEWLFTNRLEHDRHPYFEGLRGLRVSAHLFLRRRGELIQFVNFERRAWHAGVSCFRGRERCNDFSIGIELEGSDHQPFTEAQYRRLGAVISVLRAAYPAITRDRIVGHADIAPGRKTDPGPYFDWSRLP